MKIQPTQVYELPCTNFGSRHLSTKLPRELRAKPYHKVSKGLLISLIPISLLGFGSYYWKTHEKEAMEHFWKSEYGKSVFRQNLERLLRQFNITLTANDAEAAKANQNTISIWKELSNDTVQASNTISMQEALSKYAVHNNDAVSVQENSMHDMLRAFSKFVTETQDASKPSTKD